jgi:predicted RNase H-like nuclease (RuvC/YqgF family)
LEEKENVARKEIQNLKRTIELANTENEDQGRLLDEVEKQNERYENKNEKLQEYQKSTKNMRRALKRKNENIDNINNLVCETKKRLTECQVETEQKTI